VLEQGGCGFASVAAFFVQDGGMDLLELARVAAGRAHAPYSGCKVGCVLETVAGGRFTGVNVENASYGLTLCAERVAIGHAVAVEGTGMRVARLAVVCEGREFPPCGACRQVLAEFALPEGATEVTFLSRGRPVVRTLAELLPDAFHLGEVNPG
jgi:cytidine deaminase